MSFGSSQLRWRVYVPEYVSSRTCIRRWLGRSLSAPYNKFTQRGVFEVDRSFGGARAVTEGLSQSPKLPADACGCFVPSCLIL